MTATFYGNPQLTDTVVYSPTETAPTHEKDEFYQALACHLERVKRHNVHLVHGDFNVRIGLDSHAAHPTVVGKHSFYTETNNNGDRLVELCDELKFRLAQTKFPAFTGPPLDMDPPRSPARSHSHGKTRWKKLNNDLNKSYQVIYGLSGKNRRTKAEVKKMNSSPPSSDRELLSERKEYFSCLLSNVQSSIEDPPKPAKQKPANHNRTIHRRGNQEGHKTTKNQEGRWP